MVMLELNKKEALDLLDALEEWQDAIGPKELEEGEIGLDYSRYEHLKGKLQAIADEP